MILYELRDFTNSFLVYKNKYVYIKVLLYHSNFARIYILKFFLFFLRRMNDSVILLQGHTCFFVLLLRFTIRIMSVIMIMNHFNTTFYYTVLSQIFFWILFLLLVTTLFIPSFLFFLADFSVPSYLEISLT